MVPDIGTIIFDAILATVNGGSFGVGPYTLGQISVSLQNASAVQPILSFAQGVSLIVTVLLLLGLFIIKRMTATLKAPAKPVAEPLSEEAVTAPGPAPAGPYRARWDEIARHLESTREAEWKIAVLEADKLIDAVLREAKFPGDSLGERLMNMEPGTLVSLDGLWYAHKIRNRLAHDVQYFLRYVEARQAVVYYQAALEELQAI